MKVGMIVVGAGRGERLGHALPKAFVPLLGTTLIERSIRILLASASVDEVVPVVGPEDMDRYEALDIGTSPKLKPVVPGGTERQDSVAAGLAALSSEIALVGVHDAARCLVSGSEIDEVVGAAVTHGAALLAVPARDTLKRVEGGQVLETPDRASLWAAQTPQVFRVDLLGEAMEKARRDGFVGTDDASLVERLGVPVQIVRGREENMKITHPGDLVVAEAWLHAHTRAEGDP